MGNESILRKCIFSRDRKYRYSLWREWEPKLGYLMVIGLNPSTATDTKDDPTIRKCVGFAKRWGFGALCMTNLFAYRSTDPRILKILKRDPIGSSNDEILRRIAEGAKMILAAWGNHGKLFDRGERVMKMFQCKALGTNSDGSPKHPLYVPYSVRPDYYYID